MHRFNVRRGAVQFRWQHVLHRVCCGCLHNIDWIICLHPMCHRCVGDFVPQSVERMLHVVLHTFRGPIVLYFALSFIPFALRPPSRSRHLSKLDWQHRVFSLFDRHLSTFAGLCRCASTRLTVVDFRQIMSSVLSSWGRSSGVDEDLSTPFTSTATTHLFPLYFWVLQVPPFVYTNVFFLMFVRFCTCNMFPTLTVCTACPPGSYCNTTSMAHPFLCPSGTFRCSHTLIVPARTNHCNCVLSLSRSFCLNFS
jgi:hypothetical protein